MRIHQREPPALVVTNDRNARRRLSKEDETPCVSRFDFTKGAHNVFNETTAHTVNTYRWKTKIAKNLLSYDV